MQLVISSQTLMIRDRQQQEFLQKAKQIIESNKLLGHQLKELKDLQKVFPAKLDKDN